MNKLVSLFPKYKIYGRVKSIDSIQEKLGRKQIKIENLTDIAGLRIVFPNITTLHKNIQKFRQSFNIIEERDYMNQPKAGYRSYHILVRAVGLPVELQLRTPYTEDWSVVVHDTLYKGEKVPKKLVKYASRVSQYYSKRESGLGAKRPKVPSLWKSYGLPTFAFNPRLWIKR